ncbi:MAG: hypothetical protein ACWA5K_03215 [bacterium]
MKTLFKILIVLVIVLAIVMVIGILNLDKGIKAAVETLGPEMTRSEVRLADVDLSLSSGEGSLSGLYVGNPEGFKSDGAFSLGDISVAIDTDTLTADTLVIKKLHIIDPEITYESGKGGSNIDQIQRNIERFIGEAGSDNTGGDESADAGAKQLIIRSLKISGGKINYSNPLLGGATIPVELPDITLTGIGEKSGGVSAAEVVSQVLAAINRNAATAIGNSSAIKEAGSGIIEDGKKKLEGAIGGLKGLLNKD